MPATINTFEKGMYSDALPSLQPQGTFRYARNMMLGDRSHKGYGLSFEESDLQVASTGGTVVGASYVESLDGTIMFLEGDQIIIFDHKTHKVKQVAAASEFGCDWGFKKCEWINHTIKTDGETCPEVKVYWSSNDIYHVVNITEMLDPTRKAALQACIAASNGGGCGYSCDYFRIMKCVCEPVVNSISREGGGHKIENGSYQFVVKMEDNDGNDTNWYSVGQPVSVGSKNNIPGELSDWSIDVHITGLDCRYDVVHIAVVKSIDGTRDAEIVATRNYSTDGITFTYTGQVGRAISLGEIAAKRKMFIRGEDLIQKDGRLWLYGIKPEFNLNMQRRVLEETNFVWREIIVSARTAEKYNMNTFIRGENYLFGIVYNYCDGTHSKAFLMKPKGGGGGGSASSYSPSPSSGKGFEVKRPRGDAWKEEKGGLYGCPGGHCGGSPKGVNPGDPNQKSEERKHVEPKPSEDGTKDVVDSWGTALPDAINAATCDNCPDEYCCNPDGTVGELKPKGANCDGCEENEETLAKEGPKAATMYGHLADELADGIEDRHTPNTEEGYKSKTLKEGAKNIIERLENTEYKVIENQDFQMNQSMSNGSTTSQDLEQATPDVPETIITDNIGPDDPNQNEETAPIGTTDTSKAVTWADKYTTASGKHLVDGDVALGAAIGPRVVPTTNRYPDSKDCNGEFHYGGSANAPVELFGAPYASESAIIEPGVRGVPSRRTPAADPIYQNRVVLLGPEVSSVPQPAPEDLPKPLCPNRPWSLVMVAPDYANQTIQAKGIAFSTFTGLSGGQLITYPRHAACSEVNVEGHIDNNGSRQGNVGRGPGYTLHGLDTDIGKVGLSGNKLVQEAEVFGQGYRYGLYAEGKRPVDSYNGRRVDQRGARQYINLNLPNGSFSEQTISALSYLKANEVTLVDGGTNPVSTKLRESCVYFEAGSLSGAYTDMSFYSDTYNHEAPVRDSKGWHVAVKREIPDQYGAVQNMGFIKAGLEGRNFTTTHRAIAGNGFIGPYTFKRTSYVSDKVGDIFPLEAAGYERDRTVCDSPDDKFFQDLGIAWHPTMLPLDGDGSDAKNWAGGYENDTWDAATGPPRFDYYYPKVQSTLITTYLESRINPWLRATGPGFGRDGEVFYPEIKELELDSNLVSKHPWEDSYLNRFHYAVEQPSDKQVALKSWIKNFVEIITPVLGLVTVTQLEGVLDTTLTGVVGVMIVALWTLVRRLITREDYLDKMLGLPICKTDAAGGETENNIRGFEDNYFAYNYDHSRQNYENRYFAMPLNYNTCRCDDRNTNEIFYSNKQIQGSEIDSYKQFRALNYLEIPPDLGELKKMVTFNGQLYAHTTDFLMAIKYRDIQVATNIGTSLLGGNDLLTDPSPILEGVTEGAAGTIDPNAGIVTKYGYIFMDRPARKLYLFNGGGLPREISINNQRTFQEYIDFCTENNCTDEKVEGTSFYSIGYDPRFDRVLLTKNNGDKSLTLGFKIMGDQFVWEGEKDYVPQFYFNDRLDIYNVKGTGIYLQNANNGYRTFHGTSYPAEIDLIANTDGEWFTYIQTEINSEAEKGNIKDLDVSFNKIAMLNRTQSSGIQPTVVIGDNKNSIKDIDSRIREDGKIKINKVKRIFRFNNAKDNVDPNCKETAVLVKEDCKIRETVTDQDCNIQRQDYHNRIFKDNRLMYRLIYDQDQNTQIRLKSVKTEFEKDER